MKVKGKGENRFITGFALAHFMGGGYMIAEIGRLAQDVAVKVVNVGGVEKHVLNNCLAIKAYKDETVFINLTIWDKLADFVELHFKKGDELFVEGELRSNVLRLDGKGYNIPFILVDRVKFTHGNKSLEDFV